MHNAHLVRIQMRLSLIHISSRYTEAKLEPVCEELFRDIDKDTVDFVPNYDGTTTEPVSYTHLDVYKRQDLYSPRFPRFGDQRKQCGKQ